jgi:hypothetical protein
VRDDDQRQRWAQRPGGLRPQHLVEADVLVKQLKGRVTSFVRAYVRGKLFGGAIQARQLRFRAGGGSDPPGPGANAAGLGVFRCRTRCGTVYGQTGNVFGYTTFIAASPNGNRSVTVQANMQLNPDPLLGVAQGSLAASAL